MMRAGRPRSWAPFLIPGLALGLTAVVTAYAVITAQSLDRLRFENLVQKNQALLQNRMETYVALLRGADGLFTVGDDVSREEFRSFVEKLDLEQLYPGIQGIGFILRVEASWKEPVTAEVRRSGVDRFRIWPDSPHDDLFPILYLEPLDRRNRGALGFDMFTDPERREAMRRACDTGEPASTGRVTLIQEIDSRKQHGFLIYLPVYRQGFPLTTVEGRRAALAGYVYSPFRADDLLQSILGRNPSVAVDVYAGTPSLTTLLHRSHPPQTAGPKTAGPEPRFQTARRFAMAGMPWTVVYSTLPSFNVGSVKDKVFIPLVLGLLTSIALFLVLRAQVAARAQAEAASQTKDRFMATLSHELRTPLSPVLAVLSRLDLEPGLTEPVRQGLSTIRRNIELEARLIDDLLDLTRISQGKLELRGGAVDLRQVLPHAVDASIRPGAPAARVEVQLRDDDDLRLWADAPRLTQVFWNLLSNARKFTPADGTVRVRAWREDRELVVEVSDTGMGIEPELLPVIFEAFEQGRRMAVRRFGGLGLGLAISRRIVELHGGRLTAASAGKDRGATFTVRLPAAKPTGLSEPRPATPDKVAAARPAGDHDLHILLVEDHPDTAEAMAELLRTTGRKVTLAGSVAEGLAAARAAQAVGSPDGRIDLVVSDIGLPDGSGLELMAELSRLYGLRGIALTGYGMDEDVERSRGAGFARHLTKPVSLEQLETAIREVRPRG